MVTQVRLLQKVKRLWKTKKKLCINALHLILVRRSCLMCNHQHRLMTMYFLMCNHWHMLMTMSFLMWNQQHILMLELSLVKKPKNFLFQCLQTTMRCQGYFTKAKLHWSCKYLHIFLISNHLMHLLCYITYCNYFLNFLVNWYLIVV